MNSTLSEPPRTNLIEEPFPEEETDAFLEADELAFQGARLNTSARRYLLVAKTQSMFSEEAFPAVIVFVCLADNLKVLRWNSDPENFEEEFGEFVDAINYVPDDPSFEEVSKLAMKVVEGWNGSRNVPQDAGKEGAAPA